MCICKNYGIFDLENFQDRLQNGVHVGSQEKIQCVLLLAIEFLRNNHSKKEAKTIWVPTPHFFKKHFFPSVPT